MQTITIQKSTFDNLFKQTLEKLEFIKFKYGADTPIHDMHRKFHYEVCVLKAWIEREE